MDPGILDFEISISGSVVSEGELEMLSLSDERSETVFNFDLF